MSCGSNCLCSVSYEIVNIQLVNVMPIFLWFKWFDSYFSPGGGYHVCMYVCSHISKTTRPDLTKLLHVVTMIVAQSSSSSDDDDDDY